ncbi:hypothetical protein K474DRAFT_946244 [Panus rudis PR-1116 ss-1]|nr:hypothetical protein K474DRAFT_946244 [Panus rudis PR-1116 ss-1]
MSPTIPSRSIDPSLNEAAPCGVGPSQFTNAPTPPEPAQPLHEDEPIYSVSHLDLHAEHFHSLPSSSPESSSNMWVFYWPSRCKEQPATSEMPRFSDPILRSQPKPEVAPFLVCRLCYGEKKQWKPYVNCGNGLATTLRNHLRNKHKNAFDGFCSVLERRKAVREGKRPETVTMEPFDVPGLVRRLMKVVAIDDQVCCKLHLKHHTI